MILKALADYYDRKKKEPESDIPQYGWVKGRLDCIVLLDKNGKYVGLNYLKRLEGKRLLGRPTLLPYIGKQASKHTNSGKDANLLWDNSSFVLGLGNKGSLKLDSFINTIRHNLSDLEDEAVESIIQFLECGKSDRTIFSPILDHAECGKEIGEGRITISFSLQGDDAPFVFARPAVIRRISELDFSEDAPIGMCLISGKQKQPIELCHPVLKGVRKANPTDPDPNYISFNEQSFVSFGKKQGTNAPASKQSVFAYTTALNYLLATEKQRMQVGDASTVFWSKEANPIEDDFSWLLGEPPKGEEQVAYGKIRALLSAVRSGVLPQEDDQPFFVLGLAPNASRIAIRFWCEGSVKEIKQRIARHFEDLELVRAPYDREFVSLFQLLLSVATESKADNIPPNLGGDVARAVLAGTPYPRTLLASAIRRCKAEQRIPHARAALIKAVLVRNARFSKTTPKEVSVALDKTYDNIGYVLGRLFAVMERIQEQAQGGSLNKTIRDTYFGAAASSPLVTFKRLQDLAIHHLAKIRNSGKGTVWLEKLLQETMGLVPATGIPSILGIDDQGRFAVGYYHQRQDFFAKKESTETEEQGEEQ